MYENETILVMSLPQPTASLISWDHQEWLTFPVEKNIPDDVHFLIHANSIVSNILMLQRGVKQLLKQHDIRIRKDLLQFKALALIQLRPMQLTSEITQNMSGLQQELADWQPGRFAYQVINVRCLPEPVHMPRIQAPNVLWALPHNKYKEEIWRWLYG